MAKCSVCADDRPLTYTNQTCSQTCCAIAALRKREKMPEVSETFKKLVNCARCGETHENLGFMRLTQPVMDDEHRKSIYTHWAPCPTNGEPILMVIVREVK